MSISKELKELYKRNSLGLKSLLEDQNYQTNDYFHEGPFLINPWDELYDSSKYKIMFVGKQTDGWIWQEDKNIDISDLIECSLDLYKKYRNATDESGRMFWRAVNQNLTGLDENMTNLSIIWNNLWKYDQYNFAEEKVFSPVSDFRDAIIKNFNILQQEIEICRPDSVIFFTSRHFDYDLERQLNGIKFLNFNDNYSVEEFARCSHPSLPYKSYRTYHPDYLLHWRPKVHGERYSKIINLLVDDIKKSDVKSDKNNPITEADHSASHSSRSARSLEDSLGGDFSPSNPVLVIPSFHSWTALRFDSEKPLIAANVLRNFALKFLYIESRHPWRL